MAKKAATPFVMSKEISAIISRKTDVTGQEAIDLLKKKYPKAKINEGSAKVAFSIARKNLGIGKKTTPTRKASPSNDMATLKAAKVFVALVGSAKAAHDAIDQLEELQI